MAAEEGQHSIGTARGIEAVIATANGQGEQQQRTVVYTVDSNSNGQGYVQQQAVVYRQQ